MDCPIYTKDSEFWMEFINFWVGGVVQTLFIIFGFLGKFVTEHTLFENYFKLAVDGAFGSYSEASGGRLASLAYTRRRTLRSPSPLPFGQKIWSDKKNLKKKSEENLKKNFENF